MCRYTFLSLRGLPVLVIGGQGVGVYLRTSSRQNQDGSTVRYLSIAHNERAPGGPSVAKGVLPLGREDRLDVAALRRLVGSINRYLGEDAGSDAGAQVGAEPGGGLTISDSRPAGGAWLLDGLWQQLGIGAALREVLGGRRFGTDVERVVFALVANRALAPASKLAAAEWASQDVAIPGLAGMDDDQAYRVMDLLIEATPTPRCSRRCSSPWRTRSTSRSTCRSSTPPAPTSSATPRTLAPRTARDCLPTRQA